MEALRNVDATARARLVAPLLSDTVRDVRLAAASVLADIKSEGLANDQLRAALQQALFEYEASLSLNADRAESWVTLAGFRVTQGRIDEAEQAYAQARRRDQRFVPAYVNQADLYRALGREDAAEHILRDGLKFVPDAATLHHALGLLLVRTGQSNAAMQSLRMAYRLGPENPRLGYVYGVALEGLGQRDRAIEIWENVVEIHPNDQDTLNVLSMSLFQSGQPARALPYAEKLAALAPTDKARQQIVAAIRHAMMSAR